MSNSYRIIDQYQCYPFFQKIFEKIVAAYVTEFLEDNHIFFQYQFGFRKNHSTSHAIITLVEKVSKALDTGKYVVGVFLDLKKHLTQWIILYCLRN